jgi:hypothetical protein
MGKKTREKDQEMARRMKDGGIIRKHCRCPVCHKLLQINHLSGHIRTQCKTQ